MKKNFLNYLGILGQQKDPESKRLYKEEMFKLIAEGDSETIVSLERQGYMESFELNELRSLFSDHRPIVLNNLCLFKRMIDLKDSEAQQTMDEEFYKQFANGSEEEREDLIYEYFDYLSDEKQQQIIDNEHWFKYFY